MVDSASIRMKTSTVVLGLAACALTQSFEPADFNVTEALLRNGVNASALPDLSNIAEQSALSGCSAAVRSPKDHHIVLLTGYPVQLTQGHIRL